ncbi:MAG: RNA helicase [Ramalina farinacea]|uniref:RNA helicase n=1 Tax=Ramalina farinacea TaxID=258253 RepID=A0AA43QM07_9LECA|nr:RNA helicase [Ramalina farinacea]
MTLSPKVGKPPVSADPKGRPRGRRTNTPFAGMNRTTAGIRQAPRARSLDEVKRATRPKSARPQKERETFHALKMQKALSAVPYGQRTSIKAQIQKTDDFDNFPLLAATKDSIAGGALSGLEDITPTPIQKVAIPVLLGNESRAIRRKALSEDGKDMGQFLLAAETGSGKTLAYLVPILDAIKRAEVQEAEDESRRLAREKEKEQDLNIYAVTPPPIDAPHPTTGRPRAIVLLPTSELVTQVGSVVKALSHTLKFRSAMISAAYTPKVIRNRLFSPSGIDVLISTPHLLASISESDPNVLSRVTHLVIDEADSLLDRSFAPSTSTIVDKTTPSLKQLILCSATIPRSLDSYLRKRFPDMRRLVTPNLHAIPRRVQLGVVDVDKQPYTGNKMLACADTIWSIGKAANETHPSSEDEGGDPQQTTRLLVFVNEREKSQEVAEYLAAKGIDAVALNRDTPEQRQTETLAQFTRRTSAPPQILASTETSSSSDVPPSGPNYVPPGRSGSSSLSPSTPRAKRHLANTKVLVSTDLGSRGIDTLAVKHVILYDVPHTTVDFIHRLGRTGRMGRRGRGIVLVGKHDRKDVVREVREGMFKGQALI